jgi:glucokinase
MILAGDVGGTKTLLGAFERAQRRPTQLRLFRYSTTAYSRFSDLLADFMRDLGTPPSKIEAVALGVAGPVVDGVARLTNFTWGVDAAEVEVWSGAPVALLNDLEAMAYSLEVLTPDEMVVLQPGMPQPHGHAALIAAGTGLGQASLHRVNGRLIPAPSEAGHADFAARSDREWELVRMLRGAYGRAEVEHVLSGPGLLNLHRFTHDGHSCPSIVDVAPADRPAAITAGALAGRCDHCLEALTMFVSVYGAETGNLALRALPTAGVYVGGGIVRHILPAIQAGSAFLEAFLAKAPMEGLLTRIPVRLILNAETGLLGAAVHAQSLL